MSLVVVASTIDSETSVTSDKDRCILNDLSNLAEGRNASWLDESPQLARHISNGIGMTSWSQLRQLPWRRSNIESLDPSKRWCSNPYREVLGADHKGEALLRLPRARRTVCRVMSVTPNQQTVRIRRDETSFWATFSSLILPLLLSFLRRSSV